MTEEFNISSLKISNEQFKDFYDEIKNCKDAKSKEVFSPEVHLAVMKLLTEIKEKGEDLSV